jgi:hypothetical protein
MNCITRPSVGRRITVPGVVAALAAATLALGASPSHAAPNKIGPVEGLDLTFSKSAGRYVVASDWDDLARATSYRVSLTNAGTVLKSDKVTTSSWTATTTLGVGARVTVKVVPLVGKKPGKQASVTKELPDVTPPTGSYAVALDGLRATVTETDIADDLSLDADIVRQIDWDNGSGWEAWSTGTTRAHDYPTGQAAYHPRVRLTDRAGNPAVLDLTAVAIGDTEKPTGSFTATPGGAWARYSKVTVTQTGALWDDVSAAENISRVVDWDDGTTSNWTEGTTPQHVYATAGNYTPVVRLTDEAGTSNDVTTSEVGVQTDSVAPKTSLTKPAKLRSVRAWKPIRGKASDAGTGVRNVKVRIAEKRAGRWYSYLAPSRTWVKGGSTQASALKRSRGAKVVPTDGVWRYRVSGLRKGTLVVKVRGTDNLGNRSKARTYGQLLTRR